MHWGIVLLGKIMILQGVGHPISCLGVCYANDPKKGGYTTPAPALDLTTSLRGDLQLTTYQTSPLDLLVSAPCPAPYCAQSETDWCPQLTVEGQQHSYLLLDHDMKLCYITFIESDAIAPTWHHAW